MIPYEKSSTQNGASKCNEYYSTDSCDVLDNNASHYTPHMNVNML